MANCKGLLYKMGRNISAPLGQGVSMDHLREAYASSEDGDSVEGKLTSSSDLGGLPYDLRSMFSESVYDVASERRQAEKRHEHTKWVRRFPHERGNWPTHIFIPVPNSSDFVTMAEASVSDFRRRLAAAWKERLGSECLTQPIKYLKKSNPQYKRARTPSAGHIGPPEVVMNSMDPSAQQHLSLSRTVALRAHQIQPLVEALKVAVGSSRRFPASIVRGYDVLVNDDKTRTFVCLRVRGGRQPVLHLIGKVDTLMRKFNQPVYYEDPVLHVSVASVPGDVSDFMNSPAVTAKVSSTDSGRVGERQGSHNFDQKRLDKHDNDFEQEEDEGEAPSEVMLAVDSVVCKAGTRLFEVPLQSAR